MLFMYPKLLIYKTLPALKVDINTVRSLSTGLALLNGATGRILMFGCTSIACSTNNTLPVTTSPFVKVNERVKRIVVNSLIKELKLDLVHLPGLLLIV